MKNDLIIAKNDILFKKMKMLVLDFVDLVQNLSYYLSYLSLNHISL